MQSKLDLACLLHIEGNMRTKGHVNAKVHKRYNISKLTEIVVLTNTHTQFLYIIQ